MQDQTLTLPTPTFRAAWLGAGFLASLAISSLSHAATTTFTNPGTWTWTAPAGVTSVTVEAWGGGGGGGRATGNPARGGGGAGGQYAKRVVSVTPGQSYTVVVGAGGAGGSSSTGGNGMAGGDSSFGSGLVVAKGGAGGAVAPDCGTAAAGLGSTAGGVGDVIYPGGDGSPGGSSLIVFCLGMSGGAGGGGAGSTGPGGDASGTTGGTGTPVGGGNGANARTNRGDGYNGQVRGGGGSGGNANNASDQDGGNGARGEIIITYVLPPTANTTNATAITMDGATLNGVVSANDAPTIVTFEYGLTTAYGSVVAAAQSPLAASANNADVSATVSGLQCGTVYHYRVTATNSAGSTYGGDQTFTTSQCAQTRSPGSCGVATGIGSISWSPLNATASDNNYAQVSVTDNQTSRFLVCTGYGFSIPAGAIITGITVDVERRASASLVKDAAMRIVKGGTIGTTDRASGDQYPTSDAYAAHGGPTDLWGETWTAADINMSSFGAALAVQKAGSRGGSRTVRVDHMRISVAYTLPPGPMVIAIDRRDPSPTNASSVSWDVSFSTPVVGVDAADFTLVEAGVSGAAITSVTDSGDGMNYVVTASTGMGSGTLGLNLVDNDSIQNAQGEKLGGPGAGNGDFAGEVYQIVWQELCTSDNVFSDDFDRADGDPGELWATSTSSGSFGAPKIFNNRLRLTDATGNNAAAATLMKLFPGAGNKVVVEFDHFAYGGKGADGIAVTFSDATQTPMPGAFGGSLGYAQRNTTDCPSCPGFNGGWLGVGIDEYGNFSNSGQGRTDGPETSGIRRPDSVAIRGSGSKQTGYRYHRGTAANLNPQVDNNGSANPPHRYRITLDHLDGMHAWVSVERDTGAGYQMLIAPYDAKAESGQAEVPANWLVSYTGSTGGSTNVHEIDNLRVCATEMVAYQTEIDHFEFFYDTPATACASQSIRVRACQNASCSERVVGSITATFTDGKTRTFRSDDTLQFEYTSNSTVGTTSSEPPLKPLSQPKCFDTNGNPRANCNITIQGSWFNITVPNHIAGAAQTATIKAQNASCGALLAGQTRYVSFWSGYANPADNPHNSSVTINGTTIAKASPGTGVSLSFNASGEATFTLVYPDAGAVRLNASCSSTACGTQLTGNTVFVARPKALVFSAIKAGSVDNPGGTDKWIAAGAPFGFTLTAVNANDQPTPNFGRELSPDTIIIGSDLVAPAGGANPAVIAPGDPPTNLSAAAFSAGSAAVSGYSWGEVGNIKLTAALGDGDYLAAGEVKGESGLVGRFIPAAFDIEPTSDGTLAAAITGGATAFTYTGQPFGYGDEPVATITAVNTEGATVTNYTGPFNKLTLTGVEVTYPGRDNAQAQAGASCPAPGDPGCLAVTAATAPNNANHVLEGDHGVFTFTLGANASDTFTYPRDAASLVGPFTAALTLTISDVTDGDGVSDSGPADLNPVGHLIRYGRGYVRDVYGTYGNPGDTLMLPVGSEYFLGGGRWTLNSDDFGGRFSCSKSETGITVNALPMGFVTLLGGVGDLGLTVSADAAPPGGTVEVDFTWPDAWLPGPAKARATFGVFRSDDRFLYWQEP